MTAEALTAWLRDSDPALRWQVERDLLDEPPSVWEATRARVATEGFGAWLLARQDPDGQWAGGAYFPADHDVRAPEAEPGQPWTATTWTLNTLREWGLDPAVLRDRRTTELLAENSRWEYDDLPYWDGEVDCCINAFTVANGRWLGVDVSRNVEWFRRAPAARWRLELRVGRGFDALIGALDAELAHGSTRRRERDRRHRGVPRCPAVRRGVLAATGPVPPALDRRTGGAVVRPIRLPDALGLQCAQRRRVLPPGRAAGRHGAGPADGRRDGDHPGRPAAGRHLAAGPPVSGASVVRGRRPGGRTIDVADLVRHPGARLVGRRPARPGPA